MPGGPSRSATATGSGHRSCRLDISATGTTLACVDPRRCRCSTYLHVGAGLILLGLGTGFSSPAVTSVVLGAVPQRRAGMGSALHDTHQQLGIALGVAVIGALLATVYRNGVRARTGVDDGSLAITLLREDPVLARAGTAAFLTAQSTTMLVAAGCAATGAVIAALTLGRTRAQQPTM